MSSDPADPAEWAALTASWRGGYFDVAGARRRAAGVLQRAVERGDVALLALGEAYEALFVTVGEAALADPWPRLEAARAAIPLGAHAERAGRAKWLLRDAEAFATARLRPREAGARQDAIDENLRLPAAARPSVEQAWSLAAAIVLANERRDFTRALRHGQAMRELARRADDPLLAFLSAHFNAYVLLSVGDLEGAETLMRRAWTLAEGMGRLPSALTHNLALVLALQGRPAEARQFAQELAVPEPHDADRAMLALVALELGELEVADRTLPIGLAVAPGFLQPALRANSAWVRARIDLALGDAARARDGIRDFLQWAEQTAVTLSPSNASRLHQALAAACERLGDGDAAVQAAKAGAAGSFQWMAENVDLRLEALRQADDGPQEGDRHARRRQALDEATRRLMPGSTTPGELTPAGLQGDGPTLPDATLRFLAHVSHEIRTPLNGVLGLASMLAQSSLDSNQRRLVALTRHSAETLLGLCNNLLDLAKLNAGRFELTPAAFSPRALVEDVLAISAPLAAAKGLELAASLAPDLPDPLVGDAMRIRQILSNLLDNALKFTPDGRVELEARALRGDAAGPQGMRIDVRDTGIGIDAETRERLFHEEFVQAGTAVGGRRGGTGLGLALCRQLVDLMGGRIGLESEPGVGSHVWVELPLPRP